MPKDEIILWDNVEIYKKDSDDLIRVLHDIESITSKGENDPNITFVDENGKKFSYPLNDIDFLLDP